jgi:hypothetical protein
LYLLAGKGWGIAGVITIGKLLVEMRGLEPLTSCMRSITPGLQNPLNLLQLIVIAWLFIFTYYKILHLFARFWNKFLTRSLTQKMVRSYFKASVLITTGNYWKI